MPGRSDTEAGSAEGAETAIFTEIPVSSEDILNCSYSNWYDQFSSHTITEAKIFRDVPEEFIEYLQNDDIVLPKDDVSESSLFQAVEPNSDNDYSDWEEGGEDEGGEPAPGKAPSQAQNPKVLDNPATKFARFHQQIKDAIKELGSVAPKLNWSAPQDATWMMMNNTMQCHSATELYLLLKSSDYINHDLGHAFDCVTDKEIPKVKYELVLRKWAEMNPSGEFRCFVRDRQLIAITPRDLNYYSFLEDIQDEIVEKIGIFFDDVLLPKFGSNSFVFDVYLPKPLDRVYLVDVNPFARKTDSLLFTWNELATMQPNDESPAFRMVEEANSGRFATKAHSENRVPRDVVDASLDARALVELAQEWDRSNQ
ncbi:DEKNAAC105226 [Brettanomyces naardenensis]|uniref:Translation initiation factor eIF2 assembly protein n=1 Tax=Brettanomyces naardenensis TaxID=13370 RepID=A0A448YT30_BRENA|nr:DEKNAAC105226 [Brettanomyces naardenensis]